ncbi:MAG: His/Gly/Thr/Pro-type tRNA ligase C-terminal domain-containing protein [Patescibacteria group bacterium]|nr:His/Gly/Thr/Pro-type tRNA ligase C-terminal domain-containing protein [Patescibacteria group bacterium]
MRYSQVFPKTQREAPSGAQSINHKLLVRAGFIDQLMAGSWTLLPLGLRVVQKINDIIREELNKTGAQELLMPLLHPKEIWNETGRWEGAKEIMYQFKKDEKEFALSFTHEEIVVDLIRKHQVSPKDFPIKVYHFSTKFRHELRAKSGILRGREFLMKDLYSAHLTEKDMLKYYHEVIAAYLKIFKRLGLDVKVVEASGGVFTDKHSHEFQVLTPVGEDTVFYCDSCDFAQNDEISKVKEGDACPKCSKGKIKTSKAIEVGNIFPLGTMYAEKMGAFYTDNEGNKKPLWLASYGIGPTRILGTLVEMFHDDKGIIWPESVTPFDAHLVEIQNSNVKSQNYNSKLKNLANDVYEKLQKAGVEVLYDDREATAGQKFADADLIGIPHRLVISEKTSGKIEWKERTKNETELLGLEEAIKRLKKA